MSQCSHTAISLFFCTCARTRAHTHTHTEEVTSDPLLRDIIELSLKNVRVKGRKKKKSVCKEEAAFVLSHSPRLRHPQLMFESRRANNVFHFIITELVSLHYNTASLFEIDRFTPIHWQFLFFSTQGDAKVKRKVLESVTRCFVSAGCKLG